MFKSRILNTVLVISILFSTALTAETAPVDSLLKTIPADATFVVRLNNFDSALGQMDNFLAGVSPMPMAMMARGYLAQMLGSPTMAGINMQGSFAIFGTIEPGKPFPNGDMIKILVPVTDYNQFVESSANLNAPDANGVSTIKAQMGALVYNLGNYALVGSPDNYENFLVSAKSLAANTKTFASVLDAEDMTNSAKAPLWAFGNVQSASTIFGPMIKMQLEQAKQMMAAQNQPAAVMDIYSGLLDIMLEELDSVTLSLTPKADSLTIGLGLKAMPNTKMANILKTPENAKTPNKLLPYLEDGALMNFAAKMDPASIKNMQDFSMGFISLLKSEDINDTDLAKMEDLMKKSMSFMGDSLACSASINPQNKPAFAYKYIFDTKDPQGYNELMLQTADLWKNYGLSGIYEKLGITMGFEILEKTETYNGIAINTAKIDMKSTDAESQQGQMINAMYGDGFEYKWAFVDNLCVAALGYDMHKLIDQAKDDGPKQTSSEIQALNTYLPNADSAGLIGTYNLVRAIKMSMKMVQNMPGMPQTAPLDITSKGNLIFAANTKNGKLTTDIVLPKEHLMEIRNAQMMMTQQIMKAHQPAPAPN